MMTQQTINQEIKHYTKTGKLLSHPHIVCSVTGEKVTAFGQVLKNKIQKYGGLENLLKTFVSRKAKAMQKPKLVNRPKKKRKEKVIEKTKDNVYDIPVYRYEPPAKVSLLEYPEHTQGACHRPDIFLNSGRICDECYLNKVCQAACKKFSKKWNG